MTELPSAWYVSGGRTARMPSGSRRTGSSRPRHSCRVPSPPSGWTTRRRTVRRIQTSVSPTTSIVTVLRGFATEELHGARREARCPRSPRHPRATGSSRPAHPVGLHAPSSQCSPARPSAPLRVTVNVKLVFCEFPSGFSASRAAIAKVLGDARHNRARNRVLAQAAVLR